MTTFAEVRLWGTTIGAVAVEGHGAVARFEYDPAFIVSGIDPAPFTMPLGRRVYSFPGLGRDAFHGLPGLLADSLPDRFGTALIDQWLARQGRAPGDVDPVERLCYVGSRGMGALEYVPSTGPSTDDPGRVLRVDALVELASAVLEERSSLVAELDADGLTDIVRVGTSAGGARAKAVVAYSPATGEIRSGQIDHGAGFEHWLLKFDGVTGNGDRELDDSSGFGRIEYAYASMARAAGIEMPETRLLEEGGRAHFLVRRFDRAPDGDRVHMQSLGAMLHLDLNDPGGHAYEQAFHALQRLDAPMADIEQQFRRMVFNVVARNQDDHVKNIAFLMDRRGVWRLSPAYDVTYAWNPAGAWTRHHQMSIDGARDGFVRADIDAIARYARLPRGRGGRILGEIIDVVRTWPIHAETAGVPEATAEAIARAHRLGLGSP